MNRYNESMGNIYAKMSCEGLKPYSSTISFSIQLSCNRGKKKHLQQVLKLAIGALSMLERINSIFSLQSLYVSDCLG